MAMTIYFNGEKQQSLKGQDRPETFEEFRFVPNEIHIFTDEKAKVTWLNTTRYSIYYQRGLSVLSALRRDTPALKLKESELEKQFKREEATGRKRILSFLSKRNVKPVDPSEFTRVMSNYYPNGRARPLSTFLYDGAKYTGSWRYLRHGIEIPKFSWIGFNDKTTSLRVFGETTILCQLTWWHGNRAWFGGYPYQEYDLSGTWWDNRASSNLSF